MYWDFFENKYPFKQMTGNLSIVDEHAQRIYSLERKQGESVLTREGKLYACSRELSFISHPLCLNYDSCIVTFVSF